MAMTRAQGDTDDDPDEPSGGAGIFINYRQCDARGGRRCHAMLVEALSHQLAHHFGDQKVFIDRTTRPGSEYPKELKEKLAACEVLLVVIHAEWLGDLKARRGTWKDWVHYEIATVLEPGRKAVMIPVALNDVQLPKREKLPEDLRGLLLLQTFRLRSGSLPDDLTRLVAELETHVRPSWPAPKADDKKVTKPPPTVRAALGWALGAFTTALALGFASTGEAPERIFALSGFSLVLMVPPLLIMGVITLFRRPIYELERELFAEPSGRYLLFALIVGLGTIMVMLVIWGQPTPGAAGQWRSVVLVLVFVAALFGVGVTAVRQDRADREWPPKVSTRPGPLRRTVARLHDRLTSLWRPPLSRLQRDQALAVYDQLAEVVETMEIEVARGRRNWLLGDHPRKALGYSVWVAGTVGLAVGALLALIVRGDVNPGVYVLPVLFALAAGALSVGTMELGFRSQRKHRDWLIEDVKEDLEKQLRPHMPDRPDSAVHQTSHHDGVDSAPTDERAKAAPEATDERGLDDVCGHTGSDHAGQNHLRAHGTP
ncbi:MAG: TIR domain-containing protein [Actinomycetota bacterium]|nr:TIR domain-containing protein [Actinomycetota bacterium]